MKPDIWILFNNTSVGNAYVKAENRINLLDNLGKIEEAKVMKLAHDGCTNYIAFDSEAEANEICRELNDKYEKEIEELGRI